MLVTLPYGTARVHRERTIRHVGAVLEVTYTTGVLKGQSALVEKRFVSSVAVAAAGTPGGGKR